MKKIILLFVVLCLGQCLWAQETLDEIIVKSSKSSHFGNIQWISNDSLEIEILTGKPKLTITGDVFYPLHFTKKYHLDDVEVIFSTNKTKLFLFNLNSIDTSYIHPQDFKNISKTYKEVELDFLYDERKYSNEYELRNLNYRLYRFNKQQNLGRGMMLGGAVIGGIGGILHLTSSSNVEANQLDENDLSTGLYIAGGIMSFVGWIIEWNSLKHLKNISLAPEHTIGFNYKYTF